MSIKLTFWKSLLRQRYLAYRAEADRMSCGAALSNHITGGRLDSLRDAVNETLRKVRKLDPSCQLEEIK